jgi:DUF4097 and DUF4098 domain-containing protein YvlB
MKAREVFLAILIIAAGVFLYYAKSGKLDLVWDEGDLVWFGRGEEFAFEETEDIPGPLPAEIQVINAHGTVDIEGTATDKIAVAFKKSIYRRNREEARKVADLLKMVVNREEAKLVLTTNRDEFPRKNFTTHFKLTVPAGMTVLIRNSYGMVKAVKTGKTDISNPHGDVRALEIGGPLIVENSYSNVVIGDVAGDCRLNAPHSDVRVGNVQGEVLIEHTYGEVILDTLAAKATVDGKHSRVDGRHLRGDVEIGSSYEPIILNDVGPTKIRSRHCDIEAKNVNGALDLTGTYARLTLNTIRGNLKVEGPNTEIFASDITAAEISIFSSNENVELRGFSGAATITMSHGDLVLVPDSIVGPIDVRATYANISLSWPSGVKVPFEGRVISGVIHWGLADKPFLEKSNGQSLTKAFVDEPGKPTVKISTSYGDIRIEDARRAAKTI